MTEPSQYFKGRTVQEQMDEVIGYVDVRSAEVATTAIASDVAQVHQDMLDADADAQAAAASAAAAAGTLANAVKKTGEASQSIAGDIAISGALNVSGAVTVPAPTGNTNAATKKYVDDQDALDVHLAGSQAITGAKTVPLETTGTFSNQIASSQKVKNEMDNYTPMLRTTGNQTMTGVKESLNSRAFVCNYNGSARGFDCKHPADEKAVMPSGTTHYPMVTWDDKDDNIVCMLRLEHSNTDGKYRLIAYIANSGPNGSGYTSAVIATGGYS